MKFKKRGVSPVVATVLLVLLAVILAVIIFMWAKTWFTEKATKDLGAGPVLVSDVCKSVSFKVDVPPSSGGSINVNVQNLANVAIYGVQVISVNAAQGKETILGTGTISTSIKPGQTSSVGVPTTKTLNIGEQVIVLPVILGELNKGKDRRQYVCEKIYGVKATVAS